MLAANPVIAFVPTSDFARVRTFYETTLGLSLVANDEFALVFECAGQMIRVVKVGDFAPQPFTIVGWKTDNIEKTVSALEKRGVVFERFPGMQQDALGIWNAPSGARVAWFKDPDGNVLSVSFHG